MVLTQGARAGRITLDQFEDALEASLCLIVRANDLLRAVCQAYRQDWASSRGDSA